MSIHRTRLPQLDGGVFLADGGIETTLVFDDGLDLPDFAAFPLLATDEGTAALDRYFRSYVQIARRDRVGVVLETATWRANPDWSARLGYTVDELAEANRRAVGLIEAIRSTTPEVPIVISGCVGPRGDGYVVGEAMSADAARRYHSTQIRTFADTTADMIGAITMTHAEEATGVTLAARDAAMPVAIAFTVETDGHLPSGQPLGEAIEAVDEATDAYPAYYMINCAHPTHFDHVLDPAAPWAQRLGGVRANASKLSHAELDPGDPDDLAARYVELLGRLPQLRVLGGCCGTSTDHIDAISRSCAAPAASGSDGLVAQDSGRR